MDNALRDGESLPGRKLDAAILEIHEKPPLHHEEEFVLVVVLVSAVFSLQDAESEHRIVDLAQRLVEPAILHRAHDLRHVDDFERRKLDVEEGGVRILRRGAAHDSLLATIRRRALKSWPPPNQAP